MDIRVIYVGDARDVVRHALNNHCNGNVEASGLRRVVAKNVGSTLKRIRRHSCSFRVRIDLPDPQEGKDRDSEYIRSGKWTYVICRCYEEAHDFAGPR